MQAVSGPPAAAHARSSLGQGSPGAGCGGQRAPGQLGALSSQETRGPLLAIRAGQLSPRTCTSPSLFPN